MYNYVADVEPYKASIRHQPHLYRMSINQTGNFILCTMKCKVLNSIYSHLHKKYRHSGEILISLL